MKTLHVKITKICKKLFKLERQGRYEEAVSEIGDLWQDKTDFPDVKNLETSLAAEFLLRCGSAFGFLGYIKQLPNSQDKSRDLLVRARNLFLELYNVEKIAECENYLALSHWRMGEHGEAEIWLNEALAHNLAGSSDTRLYSLIIKSKIYFSKGLYESACRILSTSEKCFVDSADNFIKGNYYDNLGLNFDLLKRHTEAVPYIEQAKYFYQKARNQVYYGLAENNLALVYKTLEDFPNSHQAIDNAVNTFESIKDRTRGGFALDSKAQILVSEGKFDEALATIEKALTLLKIGKNAGYLVATMETKIAILILMDNITVATLCLIEALDIAKNKISEEAAENLIARYEKRLREHLTGKNPSEISREQIADQSAENPSKDFSNNGIELVLPLPLANLKDIQGIWINNTHLEKFGIVKDSLAIAVPCDKLKRGDLIALEEIDDGSVSCGFYDNDFGIVCLENGTDEPLLFDEEQISVIGKIVGVGLKRTADGKLLVEPLSF